MTATIVLATIIFAVSLWLLALAARWEWQRNKEYSDRITGKKP
jgi:hypothetical protein